MSAVPHSIQAAASVLQMPAVDLSEALERARVVGVLDAWSDNNPSKEPFSTWRIAPDGERKYCCASQFNRSGERSYFGRTADAARAAAAKAIEEGKV